jgi:hypothetical protein
LVQQFLFTKGHIIFQHPKSLNWLKQNISQFENWTPFGKDQTEWMAMTKEIFEEVFGDRRIQLFQLLMKG